MTQPDCRHCGAPLTRTLVDLGLSPLANSYVPLDRADVACATYPLHARVCDQCFLVQVEDAVPADKIFDADYAYHSSFSKSWLEHCRKYVDEVSNRFHLGPDDLVVEIASNDGYLLQYFVGKGIPVLGVEPAAGVAREAEKKGVPTRVEFFSEDFAKTLRAEGIKPKLICAANVLAHVPDINDFVRGLSVLLSGDAVFTVEFPHLLNLIEKVQFDTIYHEHYTYLSLVTVSRIFEEFGLRVFDVEELPTHGGSLRVYACLTGASHEREDAVDRVLSREHAANLDSPGGYDGFDARVRNVRAGLMSFLNSAKDAGRSVAAYGAAAKGNTLLNYCGVDASLISFCVDLNPAKQNTLLPGSHIPVFSPDKLYEERPDFILILPWNLKTEIAEQLSDLVAGGARFVVPIPELEVF